MVDCSEQRQRDRQDARWILLSSSFDSMPPADRADVIEAAGGFSPTERGRMVKLFEQSGQSRESAVRIVDSLIASEKQTAETLTRHFREIAADAK